jgi:predicted Rossmann fold nucleotide-binding protein DprA/Smf involved in DNA uptake
VPGNITSRQFIRHELFDQRAAPSWCQQWQDVAERTAGRDRRATAASAQQEKEAGSINRSAALAPADLNENERAIFKQLKTDTPLQIDTLAETTRLSITQLTAALLALEMR